MMISILRPFEFDLNYDLLGWFMFYTLLWIFIPSITILLVVAKIIFFPISGSAEFIAVAFLLYNIHLAITVKVTEWWAVIRNSTESRFYTKFIFGIGCLLFGIVVNVGFYFVNPYFLVLGTALIYACFISIGLGIGRYKNLIRILSYNNRLTNKSGKRNKITLSNFTVYPIQVFILLVGVFILILGSYYISLLGGFGLAGGSITLLDTLRKSFEYEKVDAY